MIAQQRIGNIQPGQWIYLKLSESSVYLLSKVERDDVTLLNYKRRNGTEDSVTYPTDDYLYVRVNKPGKGRIRRQIRG